MSCSTTSISQTGFLPDDPSVQAWRTGAGGFLDPGNRVVSHEHERQTISREPAP